MYKANSLTRSGMDAADGKLYLQVADVNQEIDNLRRSTKNHLYNFGQQAAVNVAMAIKKHRKEFHRMPVGPVGFHMSLTDTRCEDCSFVSCCMKCFS